MSGSLTSEAVIFFNLIIRNKGEPAYTNELTYAVEDRYREADGGQNDRIIYINVVNRLDIIKACGC